MSLEGSSGSQIAELSSNDRGWCGLRVAENPTQETTGPPEESWRRDLPRKIICVISRGVGESRWQMMF